MRRTRPWPAAATSPERETGPPVPCPQWAPRPQRCSRYGPRSAGRCRLTTPTDSGRIAARWQGRCPRRAIGKKSAGTEKGPYVTYDLLVHDQLARAGVHASGPESGHLLEAARDRGLRAEASPAVDAYKHAVPSRLTTRVRRPGR